MTLSLSIKTVKAYFSMTFQESSTSMFSWEGPIIIGGKVEEQITPIEGALSPIRTRIQGCGS